VSVPAMNIGTLTRPDGTYVLIIPAGRFQAGQTVQLRGQQVGYQTHNVNVTLQPGTLTQNFTLALDPLRIQEVVVTGAGLVARAERLGTARATVDSEMLQRAAEPNVITALANKSPNVITTQTSGEPGSSTAIRIRGTSTLSGTGQPTIIVDGIPINNATRAPLAALGVGGSALSTGAVPNRAFDINPDDIESIEILKGPAATSIFGASAGAGGAILITTRRGRAGMTRYGLRSTLQFENVQGEVPLQQRWSSGTVTGGRTACLANPSAVVVDGRLTSCTHNNPTWGPLLPEGTPVYNNWANLFETGTLFDNTLSMSGGTEATTFYLSLGAMVHDGFIVGDRDRYERYTVRLNAEHRLRANLRVGGNVSYVQTEGSYVGRGNTVNGLLLGALRTPPEFNNAAWQDPATGLHRSYRFPNPQEADLIANRGFDNPHFTIFNNPNLGEVGRVFGNISASWDPLPWLVLNYTLGADYANDDRSEANHVSSSGAASGGTLTRWQFYDRIIDSNLAATANWTLSPMIRGTFSLGQNLNETYFRQIWVNAQDLIAPFPFKLENTVNQSPPIDREFRRRLLGYFAQAEVDFAEQLFLTGRIRRDGSSAFGEDRFAWYPGAQVAWVFTRTFGIPENILQFGRLRLAYGESGQEPALFQLQDVMEGGGITDFNPGSILQPRLAGFGGLWTSPILSNPAIRPERVREIDAGLDVSVLNGRADLALTYYHSDANDVIFSVSVPPSTGFTTQTLNAAEIQNRGWEVAFNTRPVALEGIGLNLGFNWARNRNEVMDLGIIGLDTDGNPIPRTVTGFWQGSSFTGSTTHAQVGQPVGIFRGFGWVRCGISPDQVTATLNIAEACAGAPHGAVYLAANGLPVSDPNERIIGDPNPDWTAGINAELNVRGVRLSAFLDHRRGGQTFNMTRGSTQSLGTHAFTDIRDQTGRFQDLYGAIPDVVGPGTTSGSTADAGDGQQRQVQLGQGFFGNVGGLGTREHLMEDATHTRLREVSLAYTFTQPFVQRTLGLSSIDARISGRNLWLSTDYTGIDPEVHTGGAAVGNRGIDWFAHPTSRAFVLSLGINR
jgi:TonB-linked SusC/RagA family outer membrane protein